MALLAKLFPVLVTFFEVFLAFPVVRFATVFFLSEAFFVAILVVFSFLVESSSWDGWRDS